MAVVPYKLKKISTLLMTSPPKSQIVEHVSRVLNVSNPEDKDNSSLQHCTREI